MKLLTIFRGHKMDEKQVWGAPKEQLLFTNLLFSQQAAPKSKAPMSIDPTRITLWKEYYCRFDKVENVSRQL